MATLIVISYLELGKLGIVVVWLGLLALELDHLGVVLLLHLVGGVELAPDKLNRRMNALTA